MSFAKFLRQSSLQRLGLLALPTFRGLRYGRTKGSCRRFSWKRGIKRLYLILSRPCGRAFVVLPLQPTELNPLPSRGPLYPSPSRLHSTPLPRCRNIDLLSIAYAHLASA